MYATNGHASLLSHISNAEAIHLYISSMQYMYIYMYIFYIGIELILKLGMCLYRRAYMYNHV